ncbi:MAG: two-component regulator propeller domain-containing protein [Chryseolinea sp.]
MSLNIITLMLSAFLLLSQPVRLVGQEIHFDQISIAEGLSSNSVYTIFQDSYGVLWFGTLDGLDRYDGYTIDVFKHDNLKKQSLSNNRITQIYEDRQHHLWLYDEFSTVMIKYRPEKDEFTSYYLDKVAVGADLKSLDSLYEEKDGTLCIRSIDGYNFKYNSKEDLFELKERDSISSLSWEQIGEQKELVKSFDQYLVKSKSAFNSRNVEIRKIIKDSEGRYWIATKYDGLFSAMKQSGEYNFFSHLHTLEKFKFINSEEIYDVYEDRSNVIWIGTKNRGLYRYTHYKYKFDQIETIQISTGSLQLGTIRAITQDANKNIWVGTIDQGLIRIDASGKTGKQYKPDLNKSSSIGHRFIRSLFIDDRQNLWIGHYNGFSRYLPSSDNFIQYHPNIKSHEEIRVYDFKKGDGNSMWMAGWDLILHADIEKNHYEVISRLESKDNGFSNENIRDLELDKSGDLWIAVGEKGMSLYDKEKQQFTTLHTTPGNPRGLPSNNIYEVFKDSRENLWLASADGLCHFDPINMVCETYTINEGLPSNLVYGILEDKRGYLWISTTKGISKFDNKNKIFKNYDVSDGLQSNEFTQNAFYQNSEGVMFFGGINGLNFFHPEHVPDNPHAPQVSITTIKVFDKPLSEVELFNESGVHEKLAEHTEIILSPDQRSISFEFVAYHYVNPLKNKYAFMLEGFDDDWTYRDANVRFANYTNLEPGTYFFKVKASNSDGHWSEPIQLKLVIEQPFYTSSWFISSCAIVFLTLGIFAYRWRIATVKKQQSKKAIQLESELNFLKSQVNPHFLFNTLNNIYALCQVNSRNAAPMVGKISEMMRYMIYDCTVPLVPLQKEIDYLKNYIELNQLKSNRKLNASITIDGDPNGLKIAPLLLINFLENSFKHGDLNSNGDGFIKVYIVINELELFFTIRNSFRDRPIKRNEQGGIGLENVQHRLSLLYPGKHTLRIEKNNSIFEIELKLKLN